MLAADIVLVSPITFFEVAQKVRLGKWPEMEPFVSQLPALLER
jgi:PIN domain nuclease of toxin-antitoxin system